MSSEITRAPYIRSLCPAQKQGASADKDACIIAVSEKRSYRGGRGVIRAYIESVINIEKKLSLCQVPSPLGEYVMQDNKSQ